MSEPRSSRPPWALLSYYSHSSGCCRGFQTSKRTFTLPLSLSSLSLSLSFFSRAPLLLSLFDRAVRGAKWRGLFHLAFSCRACFSKSTKDATCGRKKGSCQHPGLTAPHVTDSRREKKKNKKKKKTQEGESAAAEMNNAMRRIRGCAELATVPRIKAQLTKTRAKYHFVPQRVQRDREPKRTNRFPLFRKSAPLLRRMKRKIRRTIKRQSCATAAPLPVSAYPGDLRSSLP